MRHVGSLVAHHLLRFSYYIQVRLHPRLREAYRLPQGRDAVLPCYWDGRSRLYDRQYGSPRRMPVLEAAIRREGGDIKRVLEVGCGTGGSLGPLARRFPHILFTGIDFSPGMVERARQNLSGLDNVMIIRQDAASLPAHSVPSQDLVFSHASFQHMGGESVRMLIDRLFTFITTRLYLEETHVRGFADGVELNWPFFPPRSFFTHDYGCILEKHATILYKKYKINNMVSCYAVASPGPEVVP